MKEVNKNNFEKRCVSCGIACIKQNDLLIINFQLNSDGVLMRKKNISWPQNTVGEFTKKKQIDNAIYS